MEIYQQLWRDAVSAFEHGETRIDPHLTDRKNDLRRGVTLVLRPVPSVHEAVGVYLNRLAAICPEQHFYRPQELHVTVLSIISGTEHWRREIRRLAAYRAIIRDVLSQQHSFGMTFRGLTATPDGIMIQGFPGGDGLTKIRNELRTAFRLSDFGDVLDRRYKLTAAHMTVMRFRQPVTDMKRMIAILEEGRQLNFGEMKVDRLQLIWSDWYASAKIGRTLKEYDLIA